MFTTDDLIYIIGMKSIEVEFLQRRVVDLERKIAELVSEGGVEHEPAVGQDGGVS